MLKGTAVSSGGPPAASSEAFPSSENGVTPKRKRRPAGTPDPDAEVVSLSPKTLLESDRYVCEICNQGFQRDQNLQMHRRRHKVPWKLLKRPPESQDQVKKKVFVCPEPSCLHHDPCHALGDLVGIKKHYRRKHSNQKQWVCDKCSKGYAVHSDFKAHLKTCGTRGHSCDCGRVFSRVESFIEHQDACDFRQVTPELQPPPPPLQPPGCYSRSVSCTSPSAAPLRGFPILSNPDRNRNINMNFPSTSGQQLTEHHLHHHHSHHDLELHLSSPNSVQNCATFLKLSIGSCAAAGEKKEMTKSNDQLELAMAEKAYADEARREAKRQIEIAEVDFANAKMIRQQAQAELEKARILKEEASRKMSSTVMEITCQMCRQHFQISSAATSNLLVPPEETSLAISYMSSATTEGEGE